MRVSKLFLVNFRNYRELDIEFEDGNNIIFGRNAQGKTNLLEAIFFLSRLKPRSARRTSHLVMRGSTFFSVGALVYTSEREVSLKAVVSEQERTLIVNGRKGVSPAEMKGKLLAVMFTPDDVHLADGEPYRRRKFMDDTIDSVDAEGSKSIASYRRALMQRNALLSQASRFSRSELTKLLEPWDMALAKSGTVIIGKRLEFISIAQKVMADEYRRISRTESEVSLRYRCTVSGEDDLISVREGWKPTAEEFLCGLEKSLERDIRLKSTASGPHRDDFEISISGLDARYYASQGDRRTIGYCLRLAEAEYMKQKKIENPVLLLDDVLSELDGERTTSLLANRPGVEQAIVTTTDDELARSVGASRLVRVSGGVAKVERT